MCGPSRGKSGNWEKTPYEWWDLYLFAPLFVWTIWKFPLFLQFLFSFSFDIKIKSVHLFVPFNGGYEERLSRGASFQASFILTYNLHSSFTFNGRETWSLGWNLTTVQPARFQSETFQCHSNIVGELMLQWNLSISHRSCQVLVKRETYINPYSFHAIALLRWIRLGHVPIEFLIVFVPFHRIQFLFAIVIVIAFDAIVVIWSIDIMISVLVIISTAIQFVLTFEQGWFTVKFVRWYYDFA